MANTQRAGRLGIGVIGAGRVGPILALALAGAGHAITGISAISDAARERSEILLPGVPILDVAEVVRRSELVILAIPGSELPSLVAGLAEVGAWQAGQLVLHTAPEYGSEVLAPALASGIIPLALHPAIVCTGTSLDLARLVGATIAVSAPSPVLPIGQALAVEMGAEPVVIADADRPAYAEALKAAQEFSRAVVRQATDALHQMGVERPDHIVGGLVRSAIEEELTAAAGRAEHEFGAHSDTPDSTRH